MNTKYKILITLLIVTFLAVTASANGNSLITSNDNRDYSTTTNNNQHYSTTNNVDNTVDNSVDNSVDQKATAVQIGGVGNTNTAINYNGDTTVNVGAQAVSQNQGQNQGQDQNQNQAQTQSQSNAQSQSQNNYQNVEIYMPSAPNHYKLDVGVIGSQITSLYSGEVLTLPNDGGDDTPIIQKAGETYTYTIKSSLPVLAYVIDSTDDDKIVSLSGVPVYDFVRKKFTHTGVHVVMDNKFRSTNQQFNFTPKNDGRYSLVIDTRVSQALDGVKSPITPDSIDIAYSAEKVGEGQLAYTQQGYIGQTVVYQNDADGNIDSTQQNVYLDHFR
jgi:hypothetical protein